jgi:hypothetical protein
MKVDELVTTARDAVIATGKAIGGAGDGTRNDPQRQEARAVEPAAPVRGSRHPELPPGRCNRHDVAGSGDHLAVIAGTARSAESRATSG